MKTLAEDAKIIWTTSAYQMTHSVWLYFKTLCWNRLKITMKTFHLIQKLYPIRSTMRARNQSTLVLLCNNHKEVQLRVKQSPWTCRQRITKKGCSAPSKNTRWACSFMSGSWNATNFVFLFFLHVNSCTSSIPQGESRAFLGYWGKCVRACK